MQQRGFFLRTFHGGNAIGHAFFLTMYAILIIGYTVMFVILDVKVLDTTKYLSAYVALVFGMGNYGDGKMHPRDSWIAHPKYLGNGRLGIAIKC